MKKQFLVHSLTMYNEDAGLACKVEAEDARDAVKQFLIKTRIPKKEKSEDEEVALVESQDLEEKMHGIDREVDLLLPHVDDTTPEDTRGGRIGSEFRNVCERESEVKFSFWRLEEYMYLVTEI